MKHGKLQTQRVTLSRGLVMVLGALFGLSTLAIAQQTQLYFYPSDIPPSVRTSGMAGRLRNGFQSGEVRANAIARTITIEWTASALENQEPNYALVPNFSDSALGDAAVSCDSQLFATNYYPTACGKLSNFAVLIAGIKTNGSTIIQRWDIIWPEMPAPTIDPGTGLSQVDVAFATVQKTTLYTGSIFASPKYISGICGLRRQGDPVSALVQFCEPNDIMAFDLTAKTLSLVASETNPLGALGTLQSLSEKNYRGISVRERSPGGYLYEFSRNNRIALPSAAPILILVDNNKDGVVDGASELSVSAYQSQGFQDLSNYVAPWLY